MESKPRPRSRLRKILWAAGILTALLAAVGLFLPAILSTSLLRGPISGLVSSRLGTEVEIGRIRLSWLGSQEVEGLRVRPPGDRDRGDGAPGGEEASGEDLARADRVVLRAGLWDLLVAGVERFDLEVERPVVTVWRDAGGRYSFEGLLGGKPAEGESPRARDRVPRPDAEEPAPRALPRLSREIGVHVRDGAVRYRDAVLGASSEAREVVLDLDAGAAGIRLEGKARVGAPGTPLGEVTLSATLRDLSGGDGEEDLRVTAAADVSRLDLRPYRALLEEVAGWSPPDRPVDGTLRVTSGDEGLEVSSTLEAGFATVSELTLKLPRSGEPEKAATLELPFRMDLASTLAALSPRVPLAEGGRLSGRVEGTLSASMPLSLGDVPIADLGRALSLGKPVRVTLDLKAEGLEGVFPRASPAPEGGEAPAPLELSPGELSLKVDASLLPDGGLSLSRASVSSPGIAVELSGSLGALSEGGDSAEPTGRPVALGGSIDLSVPRLVSLLAATLPEELRLGPGSRARLFDLAVEGRIGGEEAGTSGWAARGKVELSGPLEYGGLSVDRSAGEFRVDDAAIDLSGLVVSVNGGEIAAKELIAKRSTPPEYRLLIEADALGANYDMTPMLSYVVPFLAAGAGEADLSGTIRSRLELAARGATADELRQNLSGSGTLRIARGAVSGSRFFGELAQLLQAELGPVLFEELGSDFAIGEGKVACEKVFLLGREGSKLRNLGLRGVTWLDGRLDYGTELSALSEAIGDKKIRRILEYARKALPGDVVPLRLQGTLGEPKLALTPRLGDIDLGGLLEEGIPWLEEQLGGSDSPEKKGEGAGRKERKGEDIERRLQDIFDRLKR